MNTHGSRTSCVSVGLNPDDTLGRYPHQLSGGQRQRSMEDAIAARDDPGTREGAGAATFLIGGAAACHLLGQATQVGAGELAELLDGA